MQKMPLETQTLYAELMEQLMALEAHRSIGLLTGCFTTKLVKGETYVYFQHTEPGGVLRQIYIGRQNPLLEKAVAKFREERESFRADNQSLLRLCAQLRVGGALVTDTASARVLKGLADSGIFRLQGVLVGTQAFTVFGNLLGVRWDGSVLKTLDVDVAAERVVDIALPTINADLPQTLESLQIGFLPVPPLNPKHPSTSFKVRGNPLRVDVVTPAVKKTETMPVMIPRFRTAAQPLWFLDFLIEKTVMGAVINGGGILVNVPDPARFAFHKMIVAASRDVSEHDKVAKDLLQAAKIIDLLADERPGDLLIAWEALQGRGKSWIKQAVNGLKALERQHRQDSKKLKDLLHIP